MGTKKINFIKNYSSILLLLGGIVAGSVLGLIFGKGVDIIKPLGDIFLNLLFTAIIPLIFFTITSSVANLEKTEKLGKLFVVMIAVFLGTIIISAIVMIIAIYIFPIHQNIVVSKVALGNIATGNVGNQVTELLTTDDFFKLLSRKSMLALIIFSFLIGFATLHSGEKGNSFRSFLDSGNEVMKGLLKMIMKLAPIGLGAYFAHQVSFYGPELFGVYAKPLGIYYGTGIFYFFVFFSLYAFIAGGKRAFAVFWKNNVTPALTAVGTCSSIATVPASLLAAEKMKIPAHVRNVVIPLGAALHKDGSSMSAILQITVLFSMFGKDFTDPSTILIALGITIIVSIVEGGVPNGGYIAGALIITLYDLPMAEALPVAMILNTLVDPVVTLLNANGDVITSMMISRFSKKTKWE